MRLWLVRIIWWDDEYVEAETAERAVELLIERDHAAGDPHSTWEEYSDEIVTKDLTPKGYERIVEWEEQWQGL